MSNLISGKDALIALANGQEVEFSVNNSGWYDFGGSKVFCPNVIMCGINQNGETLNFRLKPKTVMIKVTLELPKSFKPKEGEEYFYINPFNDCGYCFNIFEGNFSDSSRIQFGAYRTEAEIKQVVAAWRRVNG